MLSTSFAFLSGCAPSTPSDTKVGATTATVSRQNLVGYTFFDAQVATPPNAKAMVYAPFKLPVSEILTSVGKHVNRGEVMMRLAVPDAKQMVLQAQSSLQSAQSAYSASKAQSDGPVRESARALAEARSAELAARNDPSADLETAVQNRKDAEEMLRSATADMNMALLPDKQAVDSAYQFLNEAKRGAKMTEVRAPISGTVVSMDATVGNDVGTTPNAPVVTIIDMGAIQIRATIPAEKKDEVQKGAKVVFTSTDPGVGPLEGIVSSLRVAPLKSGEKTSVYVAMISFDNTKGLIKPESVVKKAGVPAGKVENVLVVPVGAVSQNKDGKMVVFVQKGSDWIEVPVETGLTDGALIEVKGGVDEGAIVKVVTTIKK